MRLIASILLFASLPVWFIAEHATILPLQFEIQNFISTDLLLAWALTFLLWSLYEASRMNTAVNHVRNLTSSLKDDLENIASRERHARELLEKKCLELEEEKNALRVELLQKSKFKEVASNKAPTLKREAQSETELISFLSLLQEKGRFIDFVQQDIGSVSNEQLGAVSRVVHAGCKEVVNKCLSIEPLAESAEGDSFELKSGYDTRAWKLLGNVKDNPPYKGRILHRGWKIVKVDANSLPIRKEGNLVIYPAELQVQAA